MKVTVVCPFCEYEFETKERYVNCEMCGNGYLAEDYEKKKVEEMKRKWENIWK